MWKSLFFGLALSCVTSTAAVTLQFDLSRPEVGPFPSDAFTVADNAQKTKLRVNLPKPDCAAQPSACANVGLLNQLDGFSLLPRITLKFSGPINPDSLRQGVWFVALDDLTNEEYGLQYTGQFIPINEVVYDPATNTAYAKPDIILDQHRRFGILVTDAVSEYDGASVIADPAYQACVSQTSIAVGYCSTLNQMVSAQAPRFGGRQVVAAAVFTTMSATANLESLRSRVQSTSVSMQPVAGRSVFNIADLNGIVVQQQNKVGSSETDDLTLPLAIFGSVGQIAFGTYNSPFYLDQQLSMPNVPTARAVPDAPAAAPVAFHVYVPAKPSPANGYPVVIFGHGLGDMSFGIPSATASVLNETGFAVVAINAFGHGGGPGGHVTLTGKDGAVTQVSMGGRGVDTNGDGVYESSEGCLLPTLQGARDCLRQTVVDLVQLIRVLRVGTLDFGGGHVVNVDPSRIYYAGMSLGGIYGTMLTAVEPDIRAAAFNVAGGSMVEILRFSPGFRSAMQLVFALQNPPLAVPGGTFDDDFVLRYQPAKVVTVPGAIPRQNFLEMAEWYEMSGDPVAFAPHLRQSTLPGMPLRPVLFQVARGDMTVPNPASASLVRAANAREFTVLYRHDLARAVAPDLPKDPHAFLAFLTSLDGLAIALAGQSQIAGFLQSDGTTIPDINAPLRRLFGVNLFETPSFMPEDLGIVGP